MRRSFLACVCASTLMLGFAGNRRVLAASPEASESSDEGTLIRQGLDLRRKGQDAAALEIFRRAYASSKSGRSLAQVALAEQALGSWVDAETHLSEALAHSDDSWIARNKKSLDGALFEIQGHVGSLELLGEAKSGSVSVNGKSVATLPLSGPLRVPAGSIALEINAPGYLPIFRNFLVPARGLAREPLTFVRAGGAGANATPSPLSAPPQAVDPQAVPARTDASRPADTHEAIPPGQLAWSTRQTAGVAVGAGAIGFLALGIAFHVIHEDRASAYTVHNCETSAPPSDCADRYDAVNSSRNLAIVGYGGAAVLAGVSAYLLLSDGGNASGTVALLPRCAPSFLGVGLSCSARF